jgi:hypothetical protein
MVRKPALVISLILVLNVANAEAQKQLGEPFDLGVGQSVLITDAGIRVGFDRLAFDSRCPIGVFCIWEGNATVRIWGEESPEDRSFFELDTHPQFRTEVPYLGFFIRLLGVLPYPEDGTVVGPDDYVITMVVVREGTVPVAATTWGAIKALYR